MQREPLELNFIKWLIYHRAKNLDWENIQEVTDLVLEDRFKSFLREYGTEPIMLSTINFAKNTTLENALDLKKEVLNFFK